MMQWRVTVGTGTRGVATKNSKERRLLLGIFERRQSADKLHTLPNGFSAIQYSFLSRLLYSRFLSILFFLFWILFYLLAFFVEFFCVDFWRGGDFKAG